MIRLGSFDCETTGVDPENDRIVSAALVILDDFGAVERIETWLINPGIPIPAGATAIHGITTEHAQQYGQPPEAAIASIVASIGELMDDDPAPLVVYNAPFDLTMLDREYRRHNNGWGMLSGGLEVEGTLQEDWYPLRPVLDPMVIDKHIDTYRKGKRTLTAVCEFHGISFDGAAHGAVADATAAGRLAQHMLATPALAGATPQQLHDAQVGWAETQATGLRDYFRRIGNHEAADSVSTVWPLRPWVKP